MTFKIILYAVVLTTAAGLGFLTSYQLAGAPDPQQLARPGALKAQARAMAAQATSNQPATVAVGMPNLDGVEQSLEDWDGQPRLINFWATWCAPCRREIPLLKTLQSTQQPEGLQVIGVAFDDIQAVREYAKEAEFNYPILVGEEGATRAAEAYGLELMALPFTLVVSADGELVNAHIGEIDSDEAAVIVSVLSKLTNGELSLADAKAQLAE